VHYLLGDKGWEFPLSNDDCPGATVEHNYGIQYLRELYFKADSNYSGRFTVPVLWDKQTHTIGK
jgi:putative glutathione S-transferase